MFYPANEIESLFKCGFCHLKFLNVVKLVPECGNSICGDCYDSLKETLDESGQFKCQACHQTHAMPTGGLTDVKTIMKALQLKPDAKALSKQEIQLRQGIQDVHEKLNRLKQFDHKDAINAYCDDLQLEVMETVESVVKQADQIGNDMIKTINQYRQDLLDNMNEDKASQNEPLVSFGTLPELFSKPASSSSQLEKLSTQIKTLKDKWDRHFNQITTTSTEAEVNIALQQVKETDKSLNQLDQTMLRSMFNSRMLKFKRNAVVLDSNKFLGQLVYENAPEGNVAKGM